MTATVIVVTLNRPDCVLRCLECIQSQGMRPHQVIVVDASADDRTKSVIGDFPEVEYVRTDVGYGHMTKSRNLALRMAIGDVVVFIDDDAFAHDGWLSSLLEPYDDCKVGGVGGRALNNQPGEEQRGVHEIGKLLPNGRITGNFAANPGKVIAVDHIIGCNMSWRRTTLAEMGGLRDDYPGTEVREETDIAIRVRALGYKVIFQPAAIVTHIGAPQAKGKRFDFRYAYYAAHNHSIFLIRNFGLASPIVWRNGFRELWEILTDAARKIGGALLRLVSSLIGLMVGTIFGCSLLLRKGRNPVRTDSAGRELSRKLSEARSSAGRELNETVGSR